ncbi:MAG TPA: winged helix-turn-helix domain-containing protein [Conexibacter sp.]
MRDAWLYPYVPALAATLADDLAELGYSARARPLEGEPLAGLAGEGPADADRAGGGVASPGANGSGSRGNSGWRPPALVLVTLDARAIAVANERCARLRAVEELAEVPLLLASDENALRAGNTLPDGDELLVAPWSVDELRARVERANQRLGLADEGDVVRLGTLELNLATYQVTIDARPVDFTYMEYELLRFLITHPNRVFSREALLNRVWGYDFYGGTRTVDVHVRRVRAKLGNEHATHLLTVRSVGYRFER